MESLNRKIDKLLPKSKKKREIQPLRDPVDVNLFPVFLLNAGSSYKRQKDLRTAQLRITYTILYHTGLRINEIRHLSNEDIEKAINAAQFNIIHHISKLNYKLYLKSTSLSGCLVRKSLLQIKI